LLTANLEWFRASIAAAVSRVGKNMLKSLDVMIGISLVMLIVSMVVTLLTQFVTSTINSHGLSLRRGLRDLISHLDPALTEALSAQVADAVLRHPLVGGPPIIYGIRSRLGTVVHRNELTTILLELASPNAGVDIDANAKTALQTALTNSGVSNVNDTLDNIRSVALSLEESHPELANNVRADMAILQEARGRFVGKINGWFDQTMDRVSERFTAGARAITFACALILAVALQLDAFNLLNTLWTNDAVRQELVTKATDAIEKQKTTETGQEALKQISGLATRGLIVLPWSDSQNLPEATSTPAPPNPPGRNGTWTEQLFAPISVAFSTWSKQFSSAKLPGIFLSAFLLSLGAPFWYNSLKTILKMRSEIAGKDDAQRVARQSDGLVGPPPPDGAAAGAVAPTARAEIVLPGERGDLSAAG